MLGPGEVTVDMTVVDLHLEAGEVAKGRLEHLQDPPLIPDITLPMTSLEEINDMEELVKQLARQPIKDAAYS